MRALAEGEKWLRAKRQRKCCPPQLVRSPGARHFLASTFNKCSLAAASGKRSLFLPVIGSAQYSGNICAAGLFGVFDRRLAVLSKMTLMLA
jgi:hypothetical protein